MDEKIEKLSEGFDFIEESCGLCDVPLSFEEKEVITESEGTKSPFKVIGVCKGVFQPCGEFSRNNRLYEADHWNHILENAVFQDRLKSRDLLGMIGHMDKRIDDKDIAEGKVSHVVSKLEIREDQQGKPFLYGEMEIFDTPAGRNLKALYEGGANLYVSSRGAGKLLPVPGQTYKKVDKNSYFCETFDVVRRPGFLKAKPLYEEIKESEEQVTPSVTEATNSSWATVSVASNPEVTVVSESEVEVLKEQIDKLAKVLEKVVDDVYEANEEQIEEGRKPGESDEEMKNRLHKELVNKIEAGAEKKEKEGKFTEEERKKVHDKLDKLDDIKPVAFCGESSKAALIGALGLLSSSDVSEGLFEQIVDILKKSKEKEAE